ncbi:diguanylate cyclase domain-containing protein [Paenibacillus sp. YYML68]|uniref:diguanylate cyclase domain-containing protein n=1 Tax=Paenibacillus sp. YYML68 TaxID=2909250 RepID=UPI00248FB6AB|nr:diguanylate cyclase [Paenibacillus sp. YYML68]
MMTNILCIQHRISIWRTIMNSAVKLVMFKDFITNASLLVAAFFIIGQLYKTHPLTRQSSLIRKLAAGLSYGMLGILLMLFSIRVDADVIVDLRHIPIIVAAIQGGPVSAAVTAILISIGRIGMFNASFAALTASATMLLIALLSSLIAKGPMTIRSFLQHNVLALIAVSLVVSYNMYINGSSDRIISILSYHWIFSSLVGWLSMHVYLYIIRSHASNIRLRESEARYRKLIESSPDATFVLTNGRIAFTNEKALRLLHASVSKELLGRPLVQLVDVNEHDKAWSHLNATTDGTTGSELVQQKFIRLDGRTIDVELSVESIVYREQPSTLILARDITERISTEQKLKTALSKLQRLSELDGLTGLSNRRKLDEQLERECSKAQESAQPISMLMFDVDYFKRYNDFYGHLGGDEVLRTIASSAEKLLQEQGYMAFRYGGEEFAVVLPGVSPEETMQLAEALRQCIEELALPHAQSKISAHITVSIGAATTPPDAGLTPEQLIAQADKALYRAKAEGRNRVSLYSPELDGE